MKITAKGMFKRLGYNKERILNDRFILYKKPSGNGYCCIRFDLKDNSGYCFALVDGKPCQCSEVYCCDCEFSTGHGCYEKIKEWLKSP